VVTAALARITAPAQGVRETEKDISASNPVQENKPLLIENPISNMPPPTDHGDIGPVWNSLDLVHIRVEEEDCNTKMYRPGSFACLGCSWAAH
jgi:oxalate decarboxylase